MTNQRDYKTKYEDCVWSVLELMSTYKEQVFNDDIGGLMKTKAILKGDLTTLGSLYIDACAFYSESKNKYKDELDLKYLEYRKTMTQGDAMAQAKLDTRELRDKADEFKFKRNKAERMMKDVDSCIIEVNTINKYNLKKETYG